MMGNETFHNPPALKISKEPSILQFGTPDHIKDSINTPTLHNQSKLSEEDEENEKKEEEEQNDKKDHNHPLDSGDRWIHSQEKLYDQKGFNWNNEVELLLEDEEENNPSSRNSPPSKVLKTAKKSK